MTDITKHRIIYAAADLLSVATGWFCFNMLRYNFFRDADEMWYSVCDFLLSAPVILGQIAVPVCMLILYVISGSYNRSNTLYKSRLDETLNTLTVSFTGMLAFISQHCSTTTYPNASKPTNSWPYCYAAYSSRRRL